MTGSDDKSQAKVEAVPEKAAQSEAEDAWVPVGEIMGAHGVHGDLRVKNYNPESPLLLEVEQVYLRQGEGAPIAYRVRDAREYGPGLLLQLAGCKHRDQAQALYGAQICVARSQLPPPEDDEFYVVDAIGAQVELADGQVVGVVEGFRDYPTVDVLVVRGDDGVRELPLLEPYLVSADIPAGRIVVDHFFELELEARPRRRRR